MARETIAARRAREASERAIQQAQEAAEYPASLMKLLERASNLSNFELTVRNEFFIVIDRNAQYDKEYELSYSWTENAQSVLEDITWKVERIEEELAEARRRIAMRAEAERKIREVLTPEELELLKL